jgi:hypothetical protein
LELRLLAQKLPMARRKFEILLVTPLEHRQIGVGNGLPEVPPGEGARRTLG